MALSRRERAAQDPQPQGLHDLPFRHHAGVNCIPLLTCQLQQGLIAHGEHLTHRCQGWTDDMVRQRGWAPEVA